MKWSREIPTVDGVYWWRVDESCRPKARTIGKHVTMGIWFERGKRVLDEGEWLGPLTPAMAELWDEMAEALRHTFTLIHPKDRCILCRTVPDLLTRAERVKEGK